MASTFRLLLPCAALAAACASQPGPQTTQPAVASSPAAAPTTAPSLPAPAELPAPAASPQASAPPAPPPIDGFVPIPQTHKGKFPGFRPPKAKMFQLKPEGADACTSVVQPDGRLCPRVIEPGGDINAMHIEKVTDLLSDARAFASAPPKCFEPQHALVFYNDKGAPVGWSLVSLSCGSLTALPELHGVKHTDGKYNVTGPALSYLHGLCKMLKLDACGK